MAISYNLYLLRSAFDDFVYMYTHEFAYRRCGDFLSVIKIVKTLDNKKYLTHVLFNVGTKSE